MTTYIALLRKERGSDYGVNFPDFPGCVTAGKTLDEARRMAVEALEFHVKGMAEDHEPIPEPSTLDTIMADANNRDAIAFLVEVATKPAKSVRVNVMLPEDLLHEIDMTVPNRSRFLADASRQVLRTLMEGGIAEDHSAGFGRLVDQARSRLARTDPAALIGPHLRTLHSRVESGTGADPADHPAARAKPARQKAAHKA